MSAVAVHVHLAGREPVRLSYEAAVLLVPGNWRREPSAAVMRELTIAGLFDGDHYTPLGRQVAAVLSAEVSGGA